MPDEELLSPLEVLRAGPRKLTVSEAAEAFELRTFDQTGTLHTTPGYDDVTGVGTPNGQQFLDALAFGAGR